MHIKFSKAPKKVKIKDLCEGTTFINADTVDYDCPDVFMVIDEPSSYFVKKGEISYKSFALNLSTGRVIGFYDNQEAVIVNCELDAALV